MEVDRELIVMLNVLSLLKNKPQTYDELWKSGCFKEELHLEIALYRLHKAECIEKIMPKIWVILGYGFSFLSLYPNWQPLPVKVLDVVVPCWELGRKKDEETHNKVNGCRNRNYLHHNEEC